MDTTGLYKILFTRNLPEKYYEFAGNLGLLAESKSFIDIKINTLNRNNIQLIDSNTDAAWIFTSQNSVQCLVNTFNDLSMYNNRKCYAVGSKTAKELEKSGFTVIVPEVHNAEALAKLLERDKNESYFYFAGNIHRKTIPDFFDDHEIDYHQIECYKTNFVQPKVDIEKFDAICFCSPSAVVSFFSKYQTKKPVPCIAIGDTTAVKLLDFTEHVVMSEKANIYAMLEICHEYLNS